jgi:hypothetical protein
VRRPRTDSNMTHVNQQNTACSLTLSTYLGRASLSLSLVVSLGLPRHGSMHFECMVRMRVPGSSIIGSQDSWNRTICMQCCHSISAPSESDKISVGPFRSSLHRQSREHVAGIGADTGRRGLDRHASQTHHRHGYWRWRVSTSHAHLTLGTAPLYMCMGNFEIARESLDP